MFEVIGGRHGIRTHDPRLRRPVLYPSELTARGFTIYIILHGFSRLKLFPPGIGGRRRAMDHFCMTPNTGIDFSFLPSPAREMFR